MLEARAASHPARPWTRARTGQMAAAGLVIRTRQTAAAGLVIRTRQTAAVGLVIRMRQTAAAGLVTRTRQTAETGLMFSHHTAAVEAAVVTVDQSVAKLKAAAVSHPVRPRTSMLDHGGSLAAVVRDRECPHC